MLELLHQLQDYNHRLQSPVPPADSVKLVDILADTRRIAKPGCALFIVSDFHDFDAACEQQLFELARHTDVTLVHVFDPLERQLASNAILTISDGQSRCRIPANERRFQQAYHENYQKHLQDLTRSCQRLNLSLLSYATNDDIQHLLRERFGIEPAAVTGPARGPRPASSTPATTRAPAAGHRPQPFAGQA